MNNAHLVFLYIYIYVFVWFVKLCVYGIKPNIIHLGDAHTKLKRTRNSTRYKTQNIEKNGRFHFCFQQIYHHVIYW